MMKRRLYLKALFLSVLFISFLITGNAFGDVIIDNRAPEASWVGDWQVSGASDPYGEDSVWSRWGANTFTWHFTPSQTSHFELLMWWTEWPSRSTSVPVDIEHAGGTSQVIIDQSTNGGRWNSLGEFFFESGQSYSVTITAQPGPSSTCADAVRFVSVQGPPMAAFTADPVSGTAPLTVHFTDTSTGSVDSWSWDFNNDGTVDSTDQNPSYTFDEAGIYTVKLTVSGVGGTDEVVKSGFITVTGAGGQDVIIDNRDPEASWVGDWQVSGASDPYGEDSVWSRWGANTFTWHFTPLQTSDFELLMWWTEWPSRSTSVPVDIEHAGGTSQVIIDQSTNGGRWNSLGEFFFESGQSYRVTITAQPGPSSTCADAVRFLSIDDGAITAAFTGDPVSGVAPLTVNFTDQSSGDITEWSWDFNNDGTVDSTERNPSYTYDTIGIYTVKLTVSGPGGSHEQTKTDYINVNEAAQPPVAAFTADPVSGEAPLTVNFTDQSSGDITEWSWDFNNDGTVDSTEQNPSYTYNTIGIYTVKLTVSGPGGSHEQTRTDYINVNEAAQPPVAAFTADPVSGEAPLTVDFTDQSSGDITEWSWDFNNDGTEDSAEQNPSYTYDTIGIYTVKLTVSGPGGSHEQTRTDYINVNEPVGQPPVAAFTGDPVSGEAPLTVNFTDQSSGEITEWSWDFNNDGTVDSTEQNPSYTYNTIGTYTVKLTVSGVDGTDEVVKSGFITVTGAGGQDVIIDNRDPEASWVGDWQVSGASDPYGDDSVWSRWGANTFTWHFTPLQTSDFELLMWWTEWPSRSTSVPVDIEHAGGTSQVIIDQSTNGGRWNSLGEFLFESGQSYRVTITAQPGPSSTCADAVRFVSIDDGTITAAFTGDPVSGVAPLTVNFTDQSSGDITEWSWDFNYDGIEDATEQNPSYTYDTIGTYTVKLTVSGPGGSHEQTKTDYINVNEVAQPPVAAFTADPVSGVAPLTVSFTDQSSGDITEWSWDFNNDGTVDSTEQNPSYTYDTIGIYTVKLTVSGPGGSHEQTSTDYINVNEPVGQPPVAAFTADPVSGVAPLTVNFSDQSSGDVTEWSWDFNNDGTVDSIEQNPAHTYTAAGDYTVVLTVGGPGGTDEVIKTNHISVTEGFAEEHIYLCHVYSSSPRGEIDMLQDIGAYQEGDVWRYFNVNQNKSYVIHIVDDVAGMVEALTTEGAHVIIKGHANYGLGPIPSTSAENSQGYIDDILFIDDPRILNVSTKTFQVSISSLIYYQAYPNWEPEFQDGTSGIMPYGLNDPRGNPPYNYALTYQVPGDPTHYRIQTARRSGLQRFVGSGSPAWYSQTGAIPDPDNIDHIPYFIIHPGYFEYTGSWTLANSIPGYYSSNYRHTPSGVGDEVTQWLFKPPAPGDYVIHAWWPASSDNTLAADFTVHHEYGSDAYAVDQTTNGGQWNEIGEFYFNSKQYAVVLTDNSPSGRVIADAVRISHSDNPPDIVAANFRANTRYGDSPLTVSFTNQSTGYALGYLWDFGDGGQSTSASPIYTYNQAGTYSVTLTVSGPAGSDTITKTDYIRVGQTNAFLQAEFSNSSPSGQEEIVGSSVSFTDRSTGDIDSWAWDFNGDGIIDSYERNPVYTYTTPGIFPVILTVTDGSGNSHTETKEDYVRVVVYDQRIDNRDTPYYHYSNRTILFRQVDEIPKNELKYSRLFYESCSTGPYYLETFTHGIVFYTLQSAAGLCNVPYLRAYMVEGKTDYELWQLCQDLEPKYDYYDFSKLPSEQ